jgi:hypothetical protein
MAHCRTSAVPDGPSRLRASRRASAAAAATRPVGGASGPFRAALKGPQQKLLTTPTATASLSAAHRSLVGGFHLAGYYGHCRCSI